MTIQYNFSEYRLISTSTSRLWVTQSAFVIGNRQSAFVNAFFFEKSRDLSGDGKILYQFCTKFCKLRQRHKQEMWCMLIMHVKYCIQKVISNFRTGLGPP
jgi:hypothetical protein